MLKYMSMLKYEMLKPCPLFPMHKLGTKKALSNVKLKLLDDDTRGTGEAWLWPET